MGGQKDKGRSAGALSTAIHTARNAQDHPKNPEASETLHPFYTHATMAPHSEREGMET